MEARSQLISVKHGGARPAAWTCEQTSARIIALRGAPGPRACCSLVARRARAPPPDWPYFERQRRAGSRSC